MAAVQRQTGGYDAAFESPLPNKYECSICMLALKRPVQTICGHRFCRSCLEQQRELQGINFSCPEDRLALDDSKVFPDVAWEREVLNLTVKCTNEDINEDGELGVCQWTGELRNLEQHISECPLSRAECSNEGCGLNMTRRNLQHHLTHVCGYSEWTCQHCEQTLFRNLSQDHKHMCNKWPVPCVNDCGQKGFPRDQMEDHLTVCPLSILPCAYTKYGCHFQGTMLEREIHETTKLKLHLYYAVKKIDILEEELKAPEAKIGTFPEAMKHQAVNTETTHKLEEQVESLKKEVEESKRKMLQFEVEITASTQEIIASNTWPALDR